MKISPVQKLISYLIDIPLETIQSPINSEMSVYLCQGRCQLRTANAIYSYEDKYDNFRGAFDLIDWQIFKAENVLILGLGLGSIMQILEQKFLLDLKYTCIEIDQQIVRLAEKYILRKLRSSMEIIISDAKIYLETTTDKFDLILMDIFLDDKVPLYFESPEFLKLIQDHLTGQGFFIYNRLGFTDKDKQLSKTFYQNQFKSVFEDAGLKFIKTNYMLFSHSNYFLKRKQ